MKVTIHSSLWRIMTFLLCLVMLFSSLPVAACATATDNGSAAGETQAVASAGDEKPLAVVYAASDFQAENAEKTEDDVAAGKENMNNIIEQMQEAGYTAVNGALFCGDYTANYNTWKSDATDAMAATNAGANAVEAVLKEQWGLTDETVVYVQGNHDPAGFDNQDVSGANDAQYYGVYVLHEDDFQWRQGAEENTGNTNDSAETAEATAEALKSYLQAKVDQKYGQPIFVTAHVPLHFSYRTTSAKGGDNIYAKYIFDVLNEYGEKLNIIYLFGHDHSSTYDDYIGGAAVYLPAGDRLLVPNLGSDSAWTEHTLNFTYMNAGYVGYYGGKCTTGLSSTIFEIYKNKVVVARYGENGEANLKDGGVWATTDSKWSDTPLQNETVYTNDSEKATITLKTFDVELDCVTPPTGIMAVGDSGVLKVVGMYNTAYNVVWESSDDAVVAVTPSSDGMSATLTANSMGTATITAVVTESGTITRAVGDVTTLEYPVRVVGTTAGQNVTLLDAGEHTYFKKVNGIEADKTYVFIDIEDEGYLIGRHQALHYNAKGDEKKEGDAGITAPKRELNGGDIFVFQLPVGDELLTLSNPTNENLWWFAEKDESYTKKHLTIRTYNNKRTYKYLQVSEPDGDFLTYDDDMDRICTTDDPSGKVTAHWWYSANRGLYVSRTDNGFQYALYYSQAQTDFSVYRFNHNGTSSSILDQEKDAAGNYKYAKLPDEQVTSKVYPFEQVTITLDEDIVARVSDVTGYVNKDVGFSRGSRREGGAQTGDVIILHNGTKIVEIPVTIDMLSGTFDVTKPGTYDGLTVTYAGVKIVDGGYTLVVRDSVTLLKNDAAREFMDTIYVLATELIPGRQYLIVDTNEEGIGHAMGVTNSDSAGVTNSEVTAHNVQVQKLPVDGENRLYIDASRYSKPADETTDGLVGRGIIDQGNINEYLLETIVETNYQKAIRLTWTVTNRMYTTDGDPEYNDTCRNSWYYLVSQMQVAKDKDERLLSISKDAEDNQLTLLNQAYTNAKPDGAKATTAHWWWDQWQYDAEGIGLHLADEVAHNSLFYNWQNIIDDTKGGAATKNFQTEEPSHLTNKGKTYEHTYEVGAFRRTWIYERVTNIDTISARISDKSATITQRVEDKHESTNGATFTGDYILVDTTHADGTVTTQQVPITISMLSGTYDLMTVGTYPNLTVTYQGQTICEDYTLIINEFVANDYPEFPDEGAVRVDKQLDTTKYNYLETGVASVNLSVTGIPAQTGVDLVIILDASSSMQRCVHSTQQGQTCAECGVVITNQNNRMAVLENELQSMLETLKEPIDGYTPDVDVAVATFNGYTVINSDYELYYNGCVDDDYSDCQQIHEERPDASEILLPFTNIANLEADCLNPTAAVDITFNRGTNYDRGMELAYDLLKAKQEENARNGIVRDAVVVFMSDGAPFQYNYFHGDGSLPQWKEYLTGELTTTSTCVTMQSAAVQNVFAKYYGEGKHWMAEAIKGDPSKLYKIIDPDAMTEDHITNVNGLGAKMYAIGFGLGDDGAVTAAVCREVLSNMANDNDNDEDRYIPATSNEALKTAFSKIAGEIHHAGDAVFRDQMGSRFNLVTANKISIINDAGEAEVVDLSSNPPTITVRLYELYKRSEIGDTINGVEVTETMVGKRKPVDPTVIEVITFNDDGTAVYSNKKSGNILVGDVICANTFWYNTNKSEAKEIQANGKTILLEPETFYWNIGDMPQDELVLSYSVYLDGSMEGTRPAGIYDTNNFANLSYTNYLEKDCELGTFTPVLPWKQGAVGYAFYLVNQNGQPIINQSNNWVGSFEDSVKITAPVYKDFFLNSVGEDVMAEIIEADDVLPDGYTLFDPGAEYEVMLNSNGTGYYNVTVGRADGIMTTYVQGIESTAIQPAGKSDTQDYVTANTIVWFAVLAETTAAPDTVVIDYGQPVEIDVLSNDIMMGNFGTLQYIVDKDTYLNGGSIPDDKELWEFLQTVDVRNNPGFRSEGALGKYGVIEVLKDSNGKPTGKVRYTLNKTNGMQMMSEETFVYAVYYNGPVGAQGYYLSTVTIIPATTIYYEDGFVDYQVYNTEDLTENKEKQWVPDGNAEEDAIQGQDRPGKFSLSGLDANNIYGYDGAYTQYGTYSNGGAMKVTVDEGSFATATFTYWGTGFDVVSLSSNRSGTITVDIFDADVYEKNGYVVENILKSYMVDTYYGYTFGDHDGNSDTPNEWYVVADASDTLYQVPVMKVENPNYGRYTAVITAAYSPFFDHQNLGEYDYYLDAIRIYDPANDGKDNEVIEGAYVSDNEGWPEYYELRNKIIDRNYFADPDEDVEDVDEGIVFIDGNSALTDENASMKNPLTGKANAISDYANFGPNNELYLAPGQAVTFNVDASENVAAIHLAIKSVGGSANIKVWNAESQTIHSAKETVIYTATDLYYDITALKNKNVVIYNSGTTGILSITNIKATYKSNPNSGGTMKFMVSRASARLALTSMSVGSTAPETRMFEPERFEAKISNTKVKIGSDVTVAVVTGDDVEYITVNGTKIMGYSTVPGTDARIWQMNLPADTAGELNVAVTCYRADGLASETWTETVTVVGENNQFEDIVRDPLYEMTYCAIGTKVGA